MTTPPLRHLCHWVLVLIATGAAAVADLPEPVSPGSSGVPVRLADSCPTFSWSGSAEVGGHELVLYQVKADGSLSPVLQTKVSGDARAWTPAASQCAASGASFAWAVRALTEDGPGSWSELLLFETAGMPSDDEVRQALDTLRRYRDGWDGDVGEGLAPSLGREDGVDMSGTPPLRSGQARRYPGLQLGDPELALRSQTLGREPTPQVVTTPASFALSLSGDLELGGFVFQDGLPFIHNEGGTDYFNTAVGLNALVDVTPGLPSESSGSFNSAFGVYALYENTTGSNNTASGASALQFNTTGSSNTASGFLTLLLNTTGAYNTAIGFQAGRDSNGFSNTAIGGYALSDSATGANNNTAIGWRALKNTTGSSNTGIGVQAGAGWTSGHQNIAIGVGASGTAGESSTIRIGGSNLQSKTYIEGISATGVSGSQVLITASDQLGIATSSARFKQEIRNLEGASDKLLDLRPVSFRYKKDPVVKSLTETDTSPNPREFGLIAEEVAEVFPELVINDGDGKPFTVRYHLLTPLLLAEFQRQQADLRRQEQEIGALRRFVAESYGIKASRRNRSICTEFPEVQPKEAP